MKNIVVLPLLFFLVAACKSSGGSTASQNPSTQEPQPELFNNEPLAERTYFSIDRGREITIRRKLFVRITLAANISREDLRNYEIEFFINTDGVFDGQGTDRAYYKEPRKDLCVFLPISTPDKGCGNAYVYFGGSNETGVGELIIASEYSFRPEDEIRIANGELYYYVRVKYYDQYTRSSRVSLSEDVFPDSGEYTNATGIQMDGIDDYLGNANQADISFVEVTAIID